MGVGNAASVRWTTAWHVPAAAAPSAGNSANDQLVPIRHGRRIASGH